MEDPAAKHFSECGEHLEDLHRALPNLVSPEQISAHFEVLPNGQRVKAVSDLRYVPDPSTRQCIRAETGDIISREYDPPADEGPSADDRLEDRALPGAIRSEHARHPACENRKVDPFDHRAAAVPCAQALDREQW